MKIGELFDPDKFNGKVLGFQIHEIPEDAIFAIQDLNIGDYGRKEAAGYLLLLRRRELLEQRKDMSHEEYIESLHEMPEDTELKFRHMTKKPTGWDRQIHGRYYKVY